jgi:hypothetical protein
MNEKIDFMNDEEIFSKVTQIMEKLQKDQELQDLAERNGMSAINTFRLTPATQENVAVAMIALEIARRSGDPKYRTLTQAGLQKRKLKAEVINDHKAEAMQLINKYREAKAV